MADVMAELSIESPDGDGLSYYLRDNGTWEQMREYFVHRSPYHLKEGDPHAWAIPGCRVRPRRRSSRSSSTSSARGSGDQSHQKLYADLMDAAGLDPSYLDYLDHVPPKRWPRST